MDIEDDLQDLWSTCSDTHLIEHLDKLVELYRANPIIEKHHGHISVSPSLYARTAIYLREHTGSSAAYPNFALTWKTVRIIEDANLGV